MGDTRNRRAKTPSKKRRNTDATKSDGGKKRIYVPEDLGGIDTDGSLHLAAEVVRPLAPRDFQLPYDVWWQYQNNVLSGNVGGESDFKKIRTNIGHEAHADSEVHVCNCPPDSGCGDTCMNRLMFTECWPSHCPCGSQCANRRFQRKQGHSNSVTRFQTADKGAGIKAKAPIAKGAFIMEYVGEIMTKEEYADVVKTRYAGREHFHCMTLDSGLVVDGGTFGDEARFINHNCDPNCEIQKWNVLGCWRIGIFAKRDIAVGEELGYDYNFHSFGSDKVCHCGAVNCRGFMGAKEKLEVSSANMGVGNKSKRTKKRKKRLTNAERERLRISQLVEDFTRGLGPRLRKFANTRRTFLPRNLNSIRAALIPKSETKQQVDEAKDTQAEHERSSDEPTKCNRGKAASNDFDEEIFATKLRALQGGGRAVKTRTLAIADTDEILDRTAKLTHILLNVHDRLCRLHDEDSGRRFAKSMLKLPAKSKHAQFYAVVKRPMSLSDIHKNLLVGKYRDLDSYTTTVRQVFANYMKYYGRKSDVWNDASTLRFRFTRLIMEIRADVRAIFTRESSAPESTPAAKNMDETPARLDQMNIVRCICNTELDEGTMVQCCKCGVWQHVWCMQYTDSNEDYLCEICCPRSINLEIVHYKNVNAVSEEDAIMVAEKEAALLALKDRLEILRPILEMARKCETAFSDALAKVQGLKDSTVATLSRFKNDDLVCVQPFWKDKNVAWSQRRRPDDVLQRIRSIPLQDPLLASKLHPKRGQDNEEWETTSKYGGYVWEKSQSLAKVKLYPVPRSDSIHTTGNYSSTGASYGPVIMACTAASSAETSGSSPASNDSIMDVLVDCLASYESLHQLHLQYMIPNLIRWEEKTEQLKLMDALKSHIKGQSKVVKKQVQLLMKEHEQIRVESQICEAALDINHRVDYWTLVIDGVQYRRGDCIYYNEDDAPKRHGFRERRKASICVITSLWRDRHKRPFCSGLLLLRPPQTYYFEAQRFHGKELVLSDIEVTVQLDKALGRCWVLPKELYEKGRPNDSKKSEDDVWLVCNSYKVEKSSWTRFGPKWENEWGSIFVPQMNGFNWFSSPCGILQIYRVFNGELVVANDNVSAGENEGKGTRKRKDVAAAAAKTETTIVEREAVQNRPKRKFDEILVDLLREKSVAGTKTKRGRVTGCGVISRPADLSYLLSK